MKRIITISTITVAIAALALACAAPDQKTVNKTSASATVAQPSPQTDETRNNNPQNDPDVQEGFDRHQKEYNQNRQEEERKGGVQKPYDVDKSGDTRQPNKNK